MCHRLSIRNLSCFVLGAAFAFGGALTGGASPPTCPQLPSSSGCLRLADVRADRDAIDALLRRARQGGASDADVVEFLERAHRIQVACAGDTAYERVHDDLMEGDFPQLAFGMRGAEFAERLACNGRISEILVFDQPLPPAMTVNVPAIAIFRHPQGHAITGRHAASSSVPLRHVFSWEDPDGTYHAVSVTGMAGEVVLPPAGAGVLEIAVGPIQGEQVTDTATLVADAPAAGVKLDTCALRGAFCPFCPLHTVDCTARVPPQDCHGLLGTCFGIWTQHTVCFCNLPFTDP